MARKTMSSNAHITDAHIERLVEGIGTETLEFSEVSDLQIYGKKHTRRLTGDLAEAALNVGYEPIVYQSVLWWCFIYIPIAPRGCYFVLPSIACEDDDAEQYRAIRADWDSAQIRRHRLVVLLLLTLCVALAWWSFH